MSDRITGNRRYLGFVTFEKNPVVPAGWIYDAAINPNADITADKVRHQIPDVYSIGDTAAVTTGPVVQQGHIASGSTGAVYQVMALVGQLPTTAAPVYVDYQKQSPSSTWVSVLSTPIAITSTETIRTPVDGVVTTGEYSTGASFRWRVYTTGGASTDMALGLIATAWHRAQSG